MTTAAREHAQQRAAHLRDRRVACPLAVADATATRIVTTYDHLRFRRIHVHHRARPDSRSDRARRWRRVTQTT